MTQRKPAGQTWESWIEQQVRAAQQDGQFDNLSGKGKPIPGLDGPHDPMWWLKDLVRREKVSDVPAAMAIRVKVEREIEKLWTLTREADVRARIAALNREIAKVNRTTVSGPPTSLGLLDAEAIVRQWRERQVSTR
ncbi:MAG: DUF1992 domain-containing protein [Deltaproteobacteria bacterium]|nr:DUF1992 domain-containing protein [Deltaproteobacteria bacterium]MBI3388905.1 DUF1992 domain-containing protein [Deltaproteobacteria bacterium]